MAVPVGLNVWSRLVEATFPYLDRTAAPFDSLWLPDHVQYAGHNVAEGWSLLAWTLARYPDKLCGHEVLCNSFRNPAHLAKMAATLQALSGGRLVLGIGAGWNEEEYRAYGWPFPPARVRIAQLAEANRADPHDVDAGARSLQGRTLPDRGRVLRAPTAARPTDHGGRPRRALPAGRRGPTRRLVELPLPGARDLREEAGGAQGPLPRRGAGLRRGSGGRPRRHPDRRGRAGSRAHQGETGDRAAGGRRPGGNARPGHRDAALDRGAGGRPANGQLRRRAASGGHLALCRDRPAAAAGGVMGSDNSFPASSRA